MRVIVVDDSVIVREGLRRLLEIEGHQVADVLDHPEQITAAVRAGSPDVVILDIRMPPTFTDEGLRAAMSLRGAQPDLGILLLSQYAVPEYATRLLAAGARGTGYLLKERILQPLQLSQALARLVAGGTVIDPDLVSELLDLWHRDQGLEQLSLRENDVLRLMAEGLSDRGIADRLFISLNTVGTHVRQIFRKLQLPGGTLDNRRVLAVLAYLQRH